MESNQKKALILLSGGLDSTTIYHIALAEGFLPYALTFDYDQRHNFELQCARELTGRLPCAGHTIVKIDSTLFSHTALVGNEIDVPTGGVVENTIPVTYVPARNLLFLSHAVSLAESKGVYDIFIGVNAIDYSGYPDCRPEFIESFKRTAQLGTRCGVEGRPIEIHTPLLNLSKADIVKKANELNVDFAGTSSCYNPDPDGNSCGLCDSCRLRADGFKLARLADPLARLKMAKNEL